MSDQKTEVQNWWARNPMTYGVVHGATSHRKQDGELVSAPLGSVEFFANADRQMYEWNRPLQTEAGPFGKIFDYARYRGARVLEVGCGMGGMAMLWGKSGARITAADLNPVAIEQTRRRFELFQIPGEVIQQDGRQLSFEDATFDYAYSWGVLHHSPDLSRSISELLRVLKPGAEFGVMLYNRHSLWYLYHVLYVEGFLHRESRFLDALALASRYTDGARHEGNPHTWPITRAEGLKIFGAAGARDVAIQTFGTELDSSFRFMVPGLSFLVPSRVMKSWARRWGWSLWITGRK